MKIRRLAILVLLAGTLSSCGGGGSSSGTGTVYTPPASTGGSTSGWVSGVFKAASSFKDRCKLVRTGLDSEGNAFTDKSGTTTDEKNWLRSWTHETYLWNTEVRDVNPELSTTATATYFTYMKTDALTGSGKAKDSFHFSEPTADYLSRRNSAASAGYGAQFVVISDTVPRNVRVLYTEPGSPAEAVDGGQKNLNRGTQILSVNGIDLVYGGLTQADVDTLNKGLFPQNAGITTNFVVRDPGAITNRAITLTSTNLSEKPVNRTRLLTDDAGNKVGYILFNTFSPFSSEREIVDAMTDMQTANVKDLILDLRYNGGGLLAVASELSYMVAGNTQTAGRVFEKLRFNNGTDGVDPVTGQPNTPVPFYNSGLGFSVSSGTPLPSLNLNRVFVLTTQSTCSASESVINSLRGIGVEVIEIGDTTCGKPYGFYPQDNCGTTYYSIQFQGVNDLGFGDYADGFTPVNATSAQGVKLPGCQIVDDYEHELGDSTEGLLAAALTYRASASCPAAAMIASSRAQTSRLSVSSSPALKGPDQWIMDTNRDMTMRR
ncbi:MAG: S41 family peptidase [Asticcacaulis sp.]